MQTQKDPLKNRLARYRQIKISVIGRKSGQTISVPVWFVLDGEKLCLLPVRGSDTQWYKNVLRNPQIRLEARGMGATFRALPVAGAKVVKSVIEKFREKYGARDVKKYYSKFDVAVFGWVGQPQHVRMDCSYAPQPGTFPPSARPPCTPLLFL